MDGHGWTFFSSPNPALFFLMFCPWKNKTTLLKPVWTHFVGWLYFLRCAFQWGDFMSKGVRKVQHSYLQQIILYYIPSWFDHPIDHPFLKGSHMAAALPLRQGSWGHPRRAPGRAAPGALDSNDEHGASVVVFDGAAGEDGKGLDALGPLGPLVTWWLIFSKIVENMLKYRGKFFEWVLDHISEPHIQQIFNIFQDTESLSLCLSVSLSLSSLSLSLSLALSPPLSLSLPAAPSASGTSVQSDSLQACILDHCWRLHIHIHTSI